MSCSVAANKNKKIIKYIFCNSLLKKTIYSIYLY